MVGYSTDTTTNNEENNFIARRVSRMRPSPTLAASARAKQLTKEGKDVISLTVGETGFDPEDEVIAQTIAALERGGAAMNKYGVVAGTDKLKDAIIKKQSRDNDLDVIPEQVLVSNGGKHAIFNAMFASVNPDDKVLIPSPAWVSYFDIVEMADGVPVELATPNNSGQITREGMREALNEHPNAKWLLVNSPSNPKGSVLTPDQREEIAAQALEERASRRARREYEENVPDFKVMFDDIYEHIRFDGHGIKAGPNEKQLFEEGGSLYVNGIAKSYGMTGWRCGWSVGPQKLISEMTKLQGQATTNVAMVVQEAATAALNGDQAHLEKHRDEFLARRDKVLAKLKEIGLPVKTEDVPQGAFYVYVDISKLIGAKIPDSVKLPSGHRTLESSQDVQDYFMEAAYVGTVAGSGFHGKDAPDDFCLRLSYALEDEKVMEGLNRMGEAIGRLKLPTHRFRYERAHATGLQ